MGFLCALGHISVHPRILSLFISFFFRLVVGSDIRGMRSPTASPRSSSWSFPTRVRSVLMRYVLDSEQSPIVTWDDIGNPFSEKQCCNSEVMPKYSQTNLWRPRRSTNDTCSIDTFLEGRFKKSRSNFCNSCIFWKRGIHLCKKRSHCSDCNSKDQSLQMGLGGFYKFLERKTRSRRVLQVKLIDLWEWFLLLFICGWTFSWNFLQVPIGAAVNNKLLPYILSHLFSLIHKGS
jgi:hypothetical protein